MDKDEKNFISVLSAVAGAGTVGKVIAEKLSGKIDCPILSLEDILYEI